MTPEQIARAMAAYIREHGFTPEYGSIQADSCGCFIHAYHRLTNEDCFGGSAVEPAFISVIGAAEYYDFDEQQLRALGWTEGCTDDAAAACEIAADLLAP